MATSFLFHPMLIIMNSTSSFLFLPTQFIKPTNKCKFKRRVLNEFSPTQSGEIICVVVTDKFPMLNELHHPQLRPVELLNIKPINIISLPIPIRVFIKERPTDSMFQIGNLPTSIYHQMSRPHHNGNPTPQHLPPSLFLSLWRIANSHIPRWLHITIPFKIIILGLTDTIYWFTIYQVSVAMHMEEPQRTSLKIL